MVELFQNFFWGAPFYEDDMSPFPLQLSLRELWCAGGRAGDGRGGGGLAQDQPAQEAHGGRELPQHHPRQDEPDPGQENDPRRPRG